MAKHDRKGKSLDRPLQGTVGAHTQQQECARSLSYLGNLQPSRSARSMLTYPIDGDSPLSIDLSKKTHVQVRYLPGILILCGQLILRPKHDGLLLTSLIISSRKTWANLKSKERRSVFGLPSFRDYARATENLAREMRRREKLEEQERDSPKQSLIMPVKPISHHEASASLATHTPPPYMKIKEIQNPLR